jgi:hypothetical protein
LVFEIICQPYIPEIRLRKVFPKNTQNGDTKPDKPNNINYFPVPRTRGTRLGQAWDKVGTGQRLDGSAYAKNFYLLSTVSVFVFKTSPH